MNPHSTFRIIHYSLFSYSSGLLHTNFHQNPCGFPRISLCLLSLCSWLPQRSVLQRMGLGRTQPLRLHPWISLLSCSQPLSPHRFTQSILSLPGLSFFCLLVKPVPPRLSCRFPKATRAQISTFLPSIIH